jgi:hypothetical protein
MEPTTMMALAGGANALGSIMGMGSQASAAEDALNFQKKMWRTQQQQMAPYREAGYGALSDLQGLLADPSSIVNDPSYQFRLQQGEQAAQRALAARGGLLGGAALKSLTRYGQGMASDEFANQYNRLANLAGVGQTAATNTAQMAGQFGQQAAGLLQDVGNIRSAGMLGAGGAINNALNQYMNYNLAQQMMNQGGYGYGGGMGGMYSDPNLLGPGQMVG